LSLSPRCLRRSRICSLGISMGTLYPADRYRARQIQKL
jgi:hypothetical protein